MILTPEERLRLSLEVELRQDGGNPSFFLELLARAIEQKLWDQLDDISSFQELVDLPPPLGLGSSREIILTLVGLKHKHERNNQTIHQRMENMRRAVRDYLNPELGEQEHGKGKPGPGRGKKTDSNTTRFERGADYIIRRLKRDRPDLAQKVLDCELSANAAAIEAGFRERRITIPIDPERAARGIKRHFQPEQIMRLVQYLTDK